MNRFNETKESTQAISFRWYSICHSTLGSGS